MAEPTILRWTLEEIIDAVRAEIALQAAGIEAFRDLMAKHDRKVKVESASD